MKVPGNCSEERSAVNRAVWLMREGGMTGYPAVSLWTSGKGNCHTVEGSHCACLAAVDEGSAECEEKDSVDQQSRGRHDGTGQGRSEGVVGWEAVAWTGCESDNESRSLCGGDSTSRV